MRALVITAARVDGAPLQVRLEGGVIREMAPSVTRRPGEPQLDAAGAQLVVGLHDHHVHLRALAAASSSVAVGPEHVGDGDGLVAALRAASATLPPGAWLRAVGYHESVAGAVDRAVLDAWAPDRPVRMQHRSGMLWMLNSAAVERLGVEGAPDEGVERDRAGRSTGRLWRMDAWLGGRLRAGAGAAATRTATARQAASLARHATAAAARGVTGFTDATPGRSDDDLAALAALSRAGTVAQRLHLMVRPDQPAPPAEAIIGSPLVSTGPVKIVLDDDRLPPLDDLTATIRRAHQRRHPVAIHCVTAAQLVLALAAFTDARPAVGDPPHHDAGGDRIEHGAVIPAAVIPILAASGLTVVTQPAFVAERGDSYHADVPAGEHADLWRAASLERAGVRLAAGSDAPHGPADPWRAIDAATRRRTPSGAVLGAEEVVDTATARRWWSGYPDQPARVRRVAVGAPADLILVGPGAEPDVRATIVAGTIVWEA